MDENKLKFVKVSWQLISKEESELREKFAWKLIECEDFVSYL